MYQNELQSTVSIGRVFKVHSNTIRLRLMSWNIPIRFCGILPSKQNAFSKMSSDTLYWIGYLAGDGCIETRNGVPERVVLVSKDREHIQKFLDFIGSKAKITKHIYLERHINYMTKVRSDPIVNRLVEFGITPRKSLTLKIKQNIVNTSQFLRGIIDSDGTVGVQEGSIKISIVTGSTIFANQIVRAFKTVFSANAKKYLQRNTWCVYVSNNSVVLPILKKLYIDYAGKTVLFRKSKRVKEIYDTYMRRNRNQPSR